MPPIDPVDTNWTQTLYDGNPLTIGSQAFSTTRIIWTTQVATINVNEGNSDNKHTRYDRRYLVDPGQYDISMDIDDGGRIYAQNSAGNYVLLPAYKVGVQGNPWIVQPRTTWIWKLDTKQLGYDVNSGHAIIPIRVEAFNQTGQWVTFLSYMQLTSAYQKEAPPTDTTVLIPSS